MNPNELRAARLAKGLAQTHAAARLGVSQPYLAMLESGSRRVTPELARRAMKVYDMPPTVLPPSTLSGTRRATDPDALARDLAALGYPGFAHLRPRRWEPRNPGAVLLAALAQDDLEQNRLGFAVSLARGLAERASDEPKARALNQLEAQLDRSRLAREDTLTRTSLPEPERRWLESHRSQEARRWNVLTDWSVDDLRYPA